MMVKAVNGLPQFAAGLRGEFLLDEPMSRHTSWRTGGRAQYFYTPADREDVVALIQQLPRDLAVHWIGLGSNLLVRDGGVPGIVIRTTKGLDEIQIQGESQLYAQSGVSSAKVSRIASRNHLTGVEFLCGVPGSFGGALAMNAGAFGGETWDWVSQIECIDRSGHCHIYTASEIDFAYRSVAIPQDNWILSGWLQLDRADQDYSGKDKIRSLLEKRGSSQPVQSANAGSVFRNPQGDFAARLIETAGLKGKTIGAASISNLHANFIINQGGARSSDIERLIHFAQEKVLQHSGVSLQLEVRIIGEEA